MSLMLKLFTTILLSTSLFAASSSDIESFLKKRIGKNPNITELNIKVVDKQPLEQLKGWEAFTVSLSAKIKRGGNVQSVKQRMIYFASGSIITSELTDMKSGQELKDAIVPDFKPEFYSPMNLIYGNADAKHKVAIFSDPLCPFCRKFVPEAINYMKQYPETFAIYYYHFPLARIHPAAVTLTKAAIVAEHQGRKDVVLNMYKVNISAGERDEKKILDAFNKTLNTNVTVKDIHSKDVENTVAFDEDVIASMMVGGTPTIFFDGKKDASKKKFREVKVK
ncbi:MAG: disulfide bond formation protein DsbA [Helicobacteraceae bacterium 4484_230]|nr:MAG: disulfide bond formation protein DsbA [Helicobacteraceae bacterium 4484_230]